MESIQLPNTGSVLRHDNASMPLNGASAVKHVQCMGDNGQIIKFTMYLIKNTCDTYDESIKHKMATMPLTKWAELSAIAETEECKEMIRDSKQPGADT